MSDQEKKKSYLSIFEDISKAKPTPEGQNGHRFPGEGEQAHVYDDSSSELTDEMDHEVLMHRDAHFGGDFNVMLTYYLEENLGVQPDLDYERISYLAEVEKQLGQDLAPVVLSAAEAEKVARSRRAYEMLKEIYEMDEEEEKYPFPRLIADLILTESEEPAEEIEAIVAQGTRIVPELLQIVRSEEAYDPLFPGYGYAPYLALVCLGHLKDPSSVIPLFETLGKEMVFDEEVVLEALAEIGDPAKEFLLNIIKGRPLTQDTVNGAFALTVFANQLEVSLACLEQLQDVEVRNNSLLMTYLLFNCESVQGTPHQETLTKMAQDASLPSDFREEIKSMIHDWQ